MSIPISKPTKFSLSLSLSPPKPTTMSSSSSWSCSKCTYLNSPSNKTHCKICLSTSSSPSWSCHVCTFSNPSSAVSCRMCSTPSSALVDLSADEPRTVSAPASWALRPCGSKRPRSPGGSQSKEKMVKQDSGPEPSLNQRTLKVLSYNVWFREDLELQNRMEAIGDLIQEHTPDIICLQEVTPEIYDILQKLPWWRMYKCSVSHKNAMQRAYFCMQMIKLPVKAFRCEPFDNTVMGRELAIAEVNTGLDNSLVIATSHLESPSPGPPRWDQMFSKERVAQAKTAIDLLKNFPNVILCGDMNWDDKLDGAFPIEEGWVDAWVEMKPGEIGWTYDTKANMMLSGNRKLQKRLDRFLCKLENFKIDSIEMIGMEAIPGLSYRKMVGKTGKELVLPVLPSDHFGLLLTIQRLG